MESRSSQTKAKLIVLTIFACGFAAGLLSMNLYNRFTDPNSSDKDRWSQGFHIVERLSKELKLSTSQEEQIKGIVKETGDEYRKIRIELDPVFKDVEPKFNAVRLRQRERIRAMLSAEQLPKYEELVKQQDAKREKFRQEREEQKKESSNNK